MRIFRTLLLTLTFGCWNTPEDDADQELGNTWQNDSAAVGTPSDPFSGGNDNSDDQQRAPCTSPPFIEHDELDSAQPSNADVLIVAYVFTGDRCEADVELVDLHYRQETATEWSIVTMTRGQELNEWRGVIPTSDLNSAKIYYYIRAVDNLGQEQIDPDNADTSLLSAYYFGVSTTR